MFAKRYADKLMVIREVDSSTARVAFDQGRAAMLSGVTAILFSGKDFSAQAFNDLLQLRNLCRCNRVDFVIEGNLVLARAVQADGVLLSQAAEIETAREILGPAAIIGLTVEQIPDAASMQGVDFLEWCALTGSARPGKGLKKEMDLHSFPFPVVVRWAGGAERMDAYLARGAGGVCIRKMASQTHAVAGDSTAAVSLCGLSQRTALLTPWNDEFALIQRLLSTEKMLGGRKVDVLRIPPGDDACLLAALSRPVISTDSQRDGIHFRLDWQRPEEIGEKAIAITLSDLAASYANPIAVFINLTLPPSVTVETIEKMYQGIAKALRQYDCGLGGGNVSAGETLAMDLFVVGEGWSDVYPSRSGAQAGDSLYVTGPLGLARAGLEALQLGELKWSRPIEHFKKPRARFNAARVLAANGVRCVIDVSDGLVGDAGHIAESSGITIELNLPEGSVDRELITFCEEYGFDPVSFAMSGGEEYELLFACPPEKFEKIGTVLPDAHSVGRCLAYQGQHLLTVPPGARSFQHGK